MFKSRVTVLNQDWIEIESYKSKFKPNVGEFIYSTKLGIYLRIINIIHSVEMFSTSTIVVVEEMSMDFNIK
jgi:hypothetical protein